jgi:2-amino-4-hydroxy-6-hydroxymethyldihydropteridine diphosphokinase
MTDKVTAFIALGSNIGDRATNLRAALRLLEGDDYTQVVAASSIYISKPVGVKEQPDFLNAVAKLATTRSPDELLDLCLEIERRLGRVRTIRWGPRVIDLDILVYDDLSVTKDELVIPHPEMMNRAFVLVPLAEIAPDLVLPGGMSAVEAAAAVDTQGLEKKMALGW